MGCASGEIAVALPMTSPRAANPGGVFSPRRPGAPAAGARRGAGVVLRDADASERRIRRIQSAESAESAESALVLVASSPSGAFAASRVDVPSLSAPRRRSSRSGRAPPLAARFLAFAGASLARVGEPSTAPLARVSGFAASPDGRELAAVAAFVPAGETNDARRDEKARTGAVVVDDAEAFVGEIE